MGRTASSLIRAIRLQRTHGRASLSFTGAYPGALKISFAAVREYAHHRPITQRVAACRPYAPRSHPDTGS